MPVISGRIPKDDPLLKRRRGMIDRCTKPKNDKFHNYGGRGIKVHPAFMCRAYFVAWSIENGFHPSLQLDRIDNDGDYSPFNCRWATRSQNQRNKRTTARLADGRAVRDVLDLSRLSYRTFRNRVRDGWSVEDAASTPWGGKRPSAIRKGGDA